MSSTDSDTEGDYTDAENIPTRVEQNIENILSRKPVFKKTSNMSRSNSMNTFRQQLSQFNSAPKVRSSGRLDDRKKIEDFCKELTSDFSMISRKMDCFISCLTGVFDKVEELESKIEAIDKKLAEHNQPGPSYANVTSSQIPATIDKNRIERLEQITSEEERKRRQLEIVVTHPSLNNESENLTGQVKTFLSSHMKMEPRLIDANLKAFKSRRQNSVKIVLSDTKFKRFIFSAKKDLRENHTELTNDLYVNENLTAHNYDLLKKLKTEKKRRADENLENFERIYSFEGKIYVKVKSTDDRNNAVYIPNQISLEKFLNNFNANTRND